MRKNIFVRGFRRTSLPWIALTVVMLWGLYIFTLANFLAMPPSAGFSREVVLGTVEYGFISNIQTPVVTVSNDDDTLTIVAMDGHVTTFVTIDALGTVLDRFHIDLDLYKASQLDAYCVDPYTMVLHFVEGDLFKAVVDLRTRSYDRSMVEPEVRSFVCNAGLLVVEKSTGLFGIDANGTAQPVALISGAILDYAATIERDHVYVLAGVQNDIAMDVRVIVADSGFKEIRDSLILAKTRDSYLKTIQDVFVQDQVMTGLYVWTDKKNALNHLTVQQIDLHTGTVMNSFSNGFPVHQGRFVVDEVRDGRVSVLMQDSVHRGVNLVRTTLAYGTDPEVVPLTKTRELSQLSGYVDIGDEKGLVFWDSIRTTRALKFASTNAALLKATTSILTVNYPALIGTSLFVMIGAAFIGTIPYLMFTSLVPFVIMVGMTRLTWEFRNKASIQTAVSGSVVTLLKLYVTWYLIHGMGHFSFRPALIGGEPAIYLALVASSVVSWLISLVHIRNNMRDESVALNSFALYLATDYAQYILMVLVYVGSALILDKI